MLKSFRNASKWCTINSSVLFCFLSQLSKIERNYLLVANRWKTGDNDHVILFLQEKKKITDYKMWWFFPLKWRDSESSRFINTRRIVSLKLRISLCDFLKWAMYLQGKVTFSRHFQTVTSSCFSWWYFPSVFLIPSTGFSYGFSLININTNIDNNKNVLILTLWRQINK